MIGLVSESLRSMRSRAVRGVGPRPVPKTLRAEVLRLALFSAAIHADVLRLRQMQGDRPCREAEGRVNETSHYPGLLGLRLARPG